MTIYRSESNQLELFVFLTICGSKSNNQKWPNFIRYLSECYSIFASRSNTLTSNHHFCDSSTIRLRLQRFVIGLKDKSRIGAPIRQSLHYSDFHCIVSLFCRSRQQHLVSERLCLEGLTRRSRPEISDR